MSLSAMIAVLTTSSGHNCNNAIRAWRERAGREYTELAGAAGDVSMPEWLPYGGASNEDTHEHQHFGQLGRAIAVGALPAASPAMMAQDPASAPQEQASPPQQAQQQESLKQDPRNHAGSGGAGHGYRLEHRAGTEGARPAVGGAGPLVHRPERHDNLARADPRPFPRSRSSAVTDSCRVQRLVA